ncbi:hypothetical protein YD75_25330 [Salmonella enterica subsp. enterica serovar Typhimurium]|nr:hypothetical protein [Salmonella enterica subsp. enterica serovar Typhimurium]
MKRNQFPFLIFIIPAFAGIASYYLKRGAKNGYVLPGSCIAPGTFASSGELTELKFAKYPPHCKARFFAVSA